MAAWPRREALEDAVRPFPRGERGAPAAITLNNDETEKLIEAYRAKKGGRHTDGLPAFA